MNSIENRKGKERQAVAEEFERIGDTREKRLPELGRGSVFLR